MQNTYFKICYEKYVHCAGVITVSNESNNSTLDVRRSKHKNTINTFEFVSFKFFRIRDAHWKCSVFSEVKLGRRFKRLQTFEFAIFRRTYIKRDV